VAGSGRRGGLPLSTGFCPCPKVGIGVSFVTDIDGTFAAAVCASESPNGVGCCVGCCAGFGDGFGGEGNEVEVEGVDPNIDDGPNETDLVAVVLCNGEDEGLGVMNGDGCPFLVAGADGVADLPNPRIDGRG